ncbi:site-specific integrase [Enterococcus cecorum]|uniref:site-specific integrase n=2 Tax=Enterococcus cecorum TaxID=44008 RepID=UPI001FAD73B8|nr:site-specific integrase [Enterococcus cecorum]MCJ0543368.1 site-specific integrase [Enterococcus cecorum]
MNCIIAIIKYFSHSTFFLCTLDFKKGLETMATFKKYQKGDGTYWQFRAYLGTDEATGKRISTTRRGFKTEREAKKAYKQLLIDYEKNGGLNSKPTLNIKTFEELYNLWLESYQTTVKESTFIDTKRKFRLHILPKFGNMKLSKISIAQAQKAVNEWAKKLDSFDKLNSYCSRLMKYAISLELVDKNPFEYVIKPKSKDKDDKIKFYTKEELQTILNYLESRTHSEDELQRHQEFFYYCLVRLLAFSGVRINEALALEWSDIDFNACTLSVSKTLSKTEKGFKPSTPKTKASVRTIPLDTKTMQVLKAWRTIHKEILFMNGKRSEVVFCDIYGVQLIYNGYWYQLTNRMKNIHAPLLSFHAFRHTHASLLFASGVSMKEAQARLGHSSIQMTMDIYTHVTADQQTETVEKLSKFANF